MSKSKLKSAQYSINECVKNIKGYSFASKADMRHMLNRCIKDLHDQGYKLGHLNGLKPKHIYVLVDLWKTQGKSTATIKNYMAKLRKVGVLLDKPHLVKPGNDAYQINRRSYVPTYNKAIHQTDFSKCTDPFIRLSLEAQSLFGLRREESIKLIISEAWQGNSLKIKPSWTKGGIGRILNITNEDQRQWLSKAFQQIPAGQSLIPTDKSYKQHLGHYQNQIKIMGLSKCHGLRHAYAQRRYGELTRQFDPHNKGLICPIESGLPSRKLRGMEREWDRRAREIISRELGHSRMAITKTYLG
ncbi:phage integrase N-terminal domain-containing protein [Legionella sp. 16cNR16C]|uniref:phage integrase N-terminal domain-containing protein n=1 Tax=Legionella sp. 16cNR16C TaxID=2905656 RepID=UPI001E4923F4|nr:phage integrase N-terminal domain-containing protein [Legionella sp. 16cNR16C]MCE3045366.1 integrase domain-containing protein [Legionella sp. 16cNR16C]